MRVLQIPAAFAEARDERFRLMRRVVGRGLQELVDIGEHGHEQPAGRLIEFGTGLEFLMKLGETLTELSVVHDAIVPRPFPWMAKSEG